MFTLKSFIAEEAVFVDDVSEHKPIVIAPGRFNPPHRGHKLMIDTLIKLGHELKAKPVVIIIDSGKYGDKNPLTGDQRRKYLHMMYPMVDILIAKNPYDAVAQLATEEHDGEKYVPVGGVSGSDRADNYKKMIGRIFGPEVEKKYVSKVLTRDPDAEGDVAGASATKARDAATNGDLAKFRSVTGFEGKESEELMNAVRRGMGVE